jgi:hypothetical protein
VEFVLLANKPVRRCAIAWWEPASEPRELGQYGWDVAVLRIAEDRPPGADSAVLAQESNFRDLAAADVYGFGAPDGKDRPEPGWAPCQVRGQLESGFIQLDDDEGRSSAETEPTGHPGGRKIAFRQCRQAN